MKKLVSAILCIIFSFSLLAGTVSAEAKSICVDSVVTNFKDKSVTITGNLSGYTYSPWRKATTVGISVLKSDASPESAEEDNSKVFHIDEISVDEETGVFTYSFEHKGKEANDDCKIILSCEGYTSAKADYSFYNENAQSEILATHNVAGANSPLYYVNSLRKEAEKTPYKENGEIFIPIEIAAALAGADYNPGDRATAIGNKVFSSEYVSSAELLSAGVSVSTDYESGIIYTGTIISAGEIKSIIPKFGIHVSKNGSDSNSGSLNAPVYSISRALELYHTTRECNYIFVHNGIYDENVVIDENYSDLKLRAIGNVKLMPSSVAIQRNRFVRVTDPEVLEMLPDVARGVVLSAPVSGLTDDTTLYKVFAEGIEQPIARFPNGGGFAMADGGVMAGDEDTFETLFYSDKARLERWAKDPKARVLLFRNSGYVITKARITSTDVYKNAMHLTWSGSKPYQEIGKRFFVYDTITEIDMPGEWFIDRAKQRIYYYPTDNFDGLQIVTGTETPLTIKNSKNITIDGFTVEGSRKIGINASNSDGVSIINTTVQNVGTTGINATLLTNSLIENCVVKETGEGAIRLNYKDFTNDYSNGSDPDLKPQGNVVRNNIVHHVGIMNPISGAVYFGGTGNTFEYNTVHDTPHMGIWFLGNENIIQYNDFYNALKYCDDAGVIYGNPCLIGFGNVIQYNRVSDLKSLNPEQTELYMIYLDADTSGVTMKGNLLDATDATTAVAIALIGGGRNNIVEDNVIIGDGDLHFYMSNRYSTGSLHDGLLSSKTLTKFINKLTDEQKENWFTKYPAIEDEYGYYLEYAKGSEGNDPTGANIGIARECIVRNNIVVNASEYPNSKTHNENRNSVFNPPANRYEAAESTGNQFLASYDTSGMEARKAGANLSVIKEKEMTIITPGTADVIKAGNARFVWSADVSPKYYEVLLQNTETGEVVLNATSTEPFVDLVISTGEYSLTVKSKYEDSSLDETCSTSFECVGDEIDMISSLDLSRNPLTYKRYEKGTIKVYATDYNGNYSDITGNSYLTYTSSDTQVITVASDGSYEVKGDGTAIITVSAGAVQSSMVVYAAITPTSSSYVYRSLNPDNCEDYVDDDGNGNSIFGSAEKVSDPTGDGYAVKETFVVDSSGKKVKPRLFTISENYKTYVMGMWVYDDLKTAIRFGVTGTPKNSTNSPIVYYGLGSNSDTNYHLYHVNDLPVEVPVNFTLPRKKGWHQIFMTVEYDEGSGLSYVEFYFDGQLVARMTNNTYITPKQLEMSENGLMKERIIAKNLQSNFAFVSTSVDGEKVIEPTDDVVLLFNKALDAEKTTVTDLYFMSSDGNRIDATLRYEDKSLILTPVQNFEKGKEYTLKLNAKFVNIPTTVSTTARTVTVKKDVKFKIREELRTFAVEKNYTTADGRTLLELNLKSLLKEGRQSLLLMMAVKKSTLALEKVSIETLKLNALETLTRTMSCEEGSILEAYIWDSNESLLPLYEKITNVK